MTKQGFNAIGGKDQWGERDSLQVMKIFSQSPSLCQSPPSVRQQLTQAAFSGESRWTLDLRVREGQTITLFGHLNINLPEGTVRVCVPP